MILMQPLDISNDVDATEDEGYTEFGIPGFETPMERADDLEFREADKYLKYGIIASVLLHLALLTVVPRLGSLVPARAFLRPGEEVTPIRLVEFPNPPEKKEQPPEKPSAISDRNHTAAKERMPKAPLSPKPPIGKMEQPPQRIAALAPPVAPEDLLESREESAEKETPEPKKVESTPLDKKRPEDKKRPDGKKRVQRDRKNVDKRRVDLRPTAQEIARAISPPGGPSDFFPEGDVDEAVVDINTREDRFFSYLLHLKRKIEGVWIYPRAAAESGLGGQLMVEFLILKNGKLVAVNLLDSSGNSVLDHSAVKAIRNAAPYHPFPPRLRAKRLRIRARFIYITKSYFRRIL